MVFRRPVFRRRNGRARPRHARRVVRRRARAPSRRPYIGLFPVREKLMGELLVWGGGIGPNRYLSQIEDPNPQIFDLNFRPNMMSNWTTYRALYREYRVSCVVVYFIPQANTQNLGSPTSPNGRLILLASPDDYDAPLTSEELVQNPRSRIYSVCSSRARKVVVRPRVRQSLMVSGGGVASAGIAPKFQWVSTDFNTMNYPVLFASLDSVGVGAPRQTYMVYAKVYLKFRYRK